jgi:regulator of sigma D
MDYYDSSLENAIDNDNYLEFQQSLSGIGEALAARFTLEDNLIVLAQNNQQNPVASDASNVESPRLSS